MTQAEQARLREFTQKMREEGSAGFADGPWDETDMEGDHGLSAQQRQKRRWGINAMRQRRQRTFSDRVLTWAAILALITLVAGIGGAWLSYQPEPVTSVTTPYRLHQTPSLERVESRLTRMEKRLSHILDPYIRALNNLGGTQQQLTRKINNIEKKQATTATGFDERLENIEQRMQIADERLDSLSAALVALVNGKAGTLPGSKQPAPSTTLTPPAPAQDSISVLHVTPEPGSPGRNAVIPPAPVEPDPIAHAEQQPATTDPVDSPPDTTVVEPAPVVKQGILAPAAATKGKWAINIASYTNEHIARRKLVQMQQQGVAVELVRAEVNGKTIYRARVLGFANRRDAGSAAIEIKSKLGIEEVWITKR